MKKIFSLYILISIFAFHVQAFPPILKGKVTDASSGQPLAGATISIPEIKVSGVTNESGEFSFNSVPARGKFLLEVRYIGYRSATRLVDFAAPLLDFSLQPSRQEIQEVVVTGTAVSSAQRQNSTSVTSLNREQLLTSSTNLIDALASQVPGVAQITTGPSISKPVIRGLGFNRVVTLNDGVKQQGQQWGEEHGIEIDQFAPERAEVLRGAASLLYGSDALGGVINFVEPLPSAEGTARGEIVSNYSTNNGLSSSSLMLTGNSNGFVWRGRGTYKNAYSFDTPTGYFPNSGFNETNLGGMVGINKRWGYSHVNFSWFKNNIGFYEPDFNASGNYLDENGNMFTEDRFKSRDLEFPRQDIRHYKIGWNSNFLFSSGYLKVDLGYQKNQRRELEGPDPALFFDLNTYSADLKYYLTEKDGWQRVFGISADDGKSRNKGDEVLVPEYNSLGFGVFAYAKKTWEKSTFNTGLRYDYRQNKGEPFDDGGTTIFTPFENKFSNLSGAVGFTYALSDNTSFKANLGTAFRAPNPPELGSNGVHEGTFRYEIGNHDLDPERSYQGDATLEFGGKIAVGSVGIFNNYIHNYIYASNAPGDNIVVADPGGPQTYPVFRYGQVNANLYGAEASLTLHLGDFIHLENSFAYTHAQNRTLDRPLSFIPAATLLQELRLEPKIKGMTEPYISLGLDNYFEQQRVDATFETSTGGYSLLKAGIGTTFMMGKQQLKLYVSANNLTDKKYYNALSRLKPGRLDQADPTLGVYEPGRNITFGFFLPFKLGK